MGYRSYSVTRLNLKVFCAMEEKNKVDWSRWQETICLVVYSMVMIHNVVQVGMWEMPKETGQFSCPWLPDSICDLFEQWEPRVWKNARCGVGWEGLSSLCWAASQGYQELFHSLALNASQSTHWKSQANLVWSRAQKMFCTMQCTFKRVSLGKYSYGLNSVLEDILFFQGHVAVTPLGSCSSGTNLRVIEKSSHLLREVRCIHILRASTREQLHSWKWEISELLVVM